MMDKYTEMHFLNPIENLLSDHPVEKLKPILIFLDTNGLPTMLHYTGNKAIGNLIEILEAEFGCLGETNPQTEPPAAKRETESICHATGISGNCGPDCEAYVAGSECDET